MRHLNITDEEIELLKSALECVYSSRLDIISKNRNVLSEEAVKEILNAANKYDDLRNKITEENNNV